MTEDPVEVVLKKAQELQYRESRTLCQWTQDLHTLANDIIAAELPVNGLAVEAEKEFRDAVETVGSDNFCNPAVRAAWQKLDGLATEARNCNAPARGCVRGFTGPGAKHGPPLDGEIEEPSENPDRGFAEDRGGYHGVRYPRKV